MTDDIIFKQNYNKCKLYEISWEAIKMKKMIKFGKWIKQMKRNKDGTCKIWQNILATRQDTSWDRRNSTVMLEIYFHDNILLNICTQLKKDQSLM